MNHPIVISRGGHEVVAVAYAKTQYDSWFRPLI